jgi:biopolymer transport protein ExbB
VWVQLPKVAASSKSDFLWLYYGNANAPPANDPKGSYDPTQGLVYHFGEGEALPQDSTANASHVTRSTAKASAAGLMGGAAALDGASELVITATPALRAGSGGLTVSMWIKPADLTDSLLYGQQDGGNSLSLHMKAGKLVARAGALGTAESGAIVAGTWQHVALVVKDGLVVYVNGVEVARAQGSVPALGGQVGIGRGFKGDLDELQIATVARSADWLKLSAGSQGPDQKLLSTGAVEGAGGEESGPSYLRILLSAVTIDGWVVIGILGVMFVLSVWVMVTKIAFVARIAKDNAAFLGEFDKLVTAMRPDETDAVHEQRVEAVAQQYPHSQLHRLYAAGVQELRSRFNAYRAAGRELVLSDQSLAAIRATVDARLVRELQRLNGQMVVLTISIAGGPFLGLLGTVVGVMITFAAIAAAGDVNVNAIAPGIAAALVATVAGLAVAIPALFGYNYLTGRIGALTSDMQVFVDELTTRFAESHSA